MAFRGFWVKNGIPSFRNKFPKKVLQCPFSYVARVGYQSWLFWSDGYQTWLFWSHLAGRYPETPRVILYTGLYVPYCYQGA